MSTTRVPDVITYLFDTLTAASTVGGASVAVRLGPQLTGDFSRLALYVALEEPFADNPAPVGATASQSWTGPGARARDESLHVPCYAEAWSGDTDTRSALTAVYGIVAAVEDVLRRDPYLGATGAVWQQPGSSNHTLRWSQSSDGAAARVYFGIDVKARIGGP